MHSISKTPLSTFDIQEIDVPSLNIILIYQVKTRLSSFSLNISGCLPCEQVQNVFFLIFDDKLLYKEMLADFDYLMIRLATLVFSRY